YSPAILRTVPPATAITCVPTAARKSYPGCSSYDTYPAPHGPGLMTSAVEDDELAVGLSSIVPPTQSPLLTGPAAISPVKPTITPSPPPSLTFPYCHHPLGFILSEWSRTELMIPGV